MVVSGMSWRRASVIFCGLLVFGLVVSAGSQGVRLTPPDTVLAGDPDGGDGTPTDPPPTSDPGSTSGTVTTSDTNTVDPEADRDTVVEQALFELTEILSGLWR